MDFGTHCAVTTCKQLDFLPYTCDACHRIHCAEHRAYTDHTCPEAYTKDARVPECPICGKPVPVPRKGMDPNLAMEEHINGGCATPAATATKIFANACSFQNCKTKEAMPMRCATCRKNYCLKHRIEQDHQCSAQAGASQQRNQGSGPFRSTPAQPAASRTTPAPSAAKSNTRPQQGAMNTTGRQLAEERSLRQTNAPSNRAPASAVHANGGLSEDEALARALAESARISSSSGPTSNAPDGSNLSEEDIELQRAMQQSLAEQQRRRQQQQQQQQQQQASNSESGCCVS